jgi:hypothetical protein
MSGLHEKTASQVHATLCELVTTNAAKCSAWSEYGAVFLNPETSAFFEARLARLSDAKAGAESNLPSKKRKHNASSDADESAAPVAEVICEHWGGAVPKISLRVACMDGTTLDVPVPQRGLVCQVKRVVGQVRSALWCGACHALDVYSQRCSSVVQLDWVCIVARHGPGLDRALCRRQGGRPA